MRIPDGTALISGGTSGLGFAVARTLCTRGASVVLLGRDPGRGRKAESDLGERARFVEGDVTDERAVTRALDVAADAGPLRVAVGCAGTGAVSPVVGRNGPHPLQDFARVVEVNLLGTFNLVRLAAARMAVLDDDDGGERGVLVTTASIAASDGQVGQAAYAASKAGVVGMTLPIARELAGHHIRVVSIAPGLFRTPMFDVLPSSAVTALGSQVPHPGRLGRPEEFAALVAHVVENPMINGETIRLDGALRMNAR